MQGSVRRVWKTPLETGLVWSAQASRVPLAVGAEQFEIEVDSLLESYLCVVVLNAIFRKLEPEK